jgi:hypothetical protein
MHLTNENEIKNLLNRYKHLFMNMNINTLYIYTYMIASTILGINYVHFWLYFCYLLHGHSVKMLECSVDNLEGCQQRTCSWCVL